MFLFPGVKSMKKHFRDLGIKSVLSNVAVGIYNEGPPQFRLDPFQLRSYRIIKSKSADPIDLIVVRPPIGCLGLIIPLISEVAATAACCLIQNFVVRDSLAE